MQILPALLCLFFAVSFCYADNTVEVVGIAECADCAQNNIKASQALSGLHVTIDCKQENGEKFERRGVGQLSEEGKFTVSLPQELLEDGKLKEECYAQLHSASAAPCAAHDGLESTKIVFKSKTNDKHTFGVAGKLKISPVTCTSAFLWPHFKYPPLPKPTHPLFKGFGHHYYFPHPPIYKPKPHPVPVPIYKPKPHPVPIYKPKPHPVLVPIYKPKPHPVPIYKPKPHPVSIPIYKPKPHPVPIYKPKPHPVPVPIYKPKPHPVPIYKPKPHPVPVPVYKPKPHPVPIYKPKPHPVPAPIYKPKPPIYKPPVVLPPPVPIYKPKPHPIPIYKPKPPIYHKPLPPFPKFPPKSYFHHHHHHPNIGKFLPPLPPYSPIH